MFYRIDFKKCPFTNPDGSIIKGKEAEFFKWAKIKHDNALALLPPEKQKEILEGENRLARRMNS